MYSGETQNYKLPQFAPTDAIDPIADFNPAFETIDAKLYQALTSYERCEQLVGTANSAAQQAQADARIATNAASAAHKEVEQNTEDLNRFKSEVENLHLRVDGLEAMNALLLKRIEALEEKVNE